MAEITENQLQRFFALLRAQIQVPSFSLNSAEFEYIITHADQLGLAVTVCDLLEILKSDIPVDPRNALVRAIEATGLGYTEFRDIAPDEIPFLEASAGLPDIMHLGTRVQTGVALGQINLQNKKPADPLASLRFAAASLHLLGPDYRMVTFFHYNGKLFYFILYKNDQDKFSLVVDQADAEVDSWGPHYRFLVTPKEKE